jgi:hypothetical protein
MQEERVLHEAKLAKMEAEMKVVFQQKVQEKEAKLKQSEEELYARHREMKESLEKQRLDLEEKKRKIENGRPLTPEKGTVSNCPVFLHNMASDTICFSSRKQGRVSSALELSVDYFFFFFFFLLPGKYSAIHASHFMACLLLSAPPCLTLVSYAPLSTLSIVFQLVRLAPVTRLHGYPRHVLPTASFSMSTSSPSPPCSCFRWNFH